MKEEVSIRLTFPAMFDETLRKHGKCNAYAFAGEEPRSYERVWQMRFWLLQLFWKRRELSRETELQY
ncbi:MAG: hypothetical protein MZV63_46380 [Marinilabiliales bacterium]|nr:hypothetical protein [Marinilabiliales bacterium]